MDRMKQRLADALRAVTALQMALKLSSPSDLERDGAIQRFEFTYEAVWKAAQTYLENHEGFQAPSPRSVFRCMGKAGILDEAESLMALEMSDDRNRTVHTYIEAVAIQIFARLPGYASLLQAIVARIGERLNSPQ